MSARPRKIVPDLPKFISSLIICLGTGFISSFFTVSAIKNWYPFLNKPWFNPPNWIFGPVWSLLYLLMAISLYLIWKKGLFTKKKITTAGAIFFVQLFLNFLWSIIFFGLKNPLLALADIVVLWTAIFITIKHFYRLDKTAAYLLIPYLLWVSFAIILNLSIVFLN